MHFGANISFFFVIDFGFLSRDLTLLPVLRGGGEDHISPAQPPESGALNKKSNTMTPSGSLDRWIEGSQTPKGHKHEIQHALGQRPGEFFWRSPGIILYASRARRGQARGQNQKIIIFPLFFLDFLAKNLIFEVPRPRRSFLPSESS